MSLSHDWQADLLLLHVPVSDLAILNIMFVSKRRPLPVLIVCES